MAKSMRSKREKRLRAIRRKMVEPLYEKKDTTRLAAQEAALAAPKLPVRSKPTSTLMETSDPIKTENASLMGTIFLRDEAYVEALGHAFGFWFARLYLMSIESVLCSYGSQ
ncbi:hypothetical protein LIER_09767 [Lithospermum erythrorhizon]|uniref:Uncharacterized protein n=1 Tax=Lithospermum erythrorhizon TaxID=34254 RepID=A0AAV3PH23_LITER